MRIPPQWGIATAPTMNRPFRQVSQFSETVLNIPILALSVMFPLPRTPFNLPSGYESYLPFRVLLHQKILMCALRPTVMATTSVIFIPCTTSSHSALYCYYTFIKSYLFHYSVNSLRAKITFYTSSYPLQHFMQCLAHSRYSIHVFGVIYFLFLWFDTKVSYNNGTLIKIRFRKC